MTTRKIKPTPGNTPLDRQHILALLTSMAEAEDRRRDEAIGAFLEGFAKAPNYNIRWRLDSIPKLVASSDTYSKAVAYLSTDDPERDLRGMMIYLRDYAATEVDRIVDMQSWNRHSTSPWANLVDIGEVNGRISAWLAIRKFFEWALTEISREQAKTAKGAKP